MVVIGKTMGMSAAELTENELPYEFISSLKTVKIKAIRIKDREYINNCLDAELAYDPYNHFGKNA